MIEEIQKTREYLNYLEEHYNNVQKSWKIIKEKCKHLNFIYDDWRFFCLDRDIKLHDQSKLSKAEFVPYRRKFYPTEFESKNLQKSIDENFNLAWGNHKICNNHHWEHWTKVEYSVDCDLKVVHNVCDWMAMGIKFDDTAKEYYEKNKDKIKIPSWAETFMYQIFELI